MRAAPKEKKVNSEDYKEGIGSSMHAGDIQVRPSSDSNRHFDDGESGTGKELIANCITSTARADGPFTAVNWGCYSESLIESELFGHEKEALRGASRRIEN